MTDEGTEQPPPRKHWNPLDGKPAWMVLSLAAVIVLVGVSVSMLTRGSEAERLCRDELEGRLGEDGVVDVGNIEERSSGELTKVEGSLAYREEQGAGDRHDTWFICQLESPGGNLSVRDLTIK